MMWLYNSKLLQKYASGEVISCDEADENRRRAILGHLVGLVSAVIGAPFFYFLNAIPFSVMLLFLGAYSILGMLFFGALLQCVRLSSRRWWLTPEGVEFRTSGLFTVMEAVIMIFVAIGMVATLWVAIFSAHASEYNSRYGAIGTVLTMLTLLIYSWDVTAPHDPPGRRVITLYPGGLRIDRDSGEGVSFSWWQSPQVSGVRFRNGVAIIDLKRDSAFPVELSLRLTPISYVRFEQLISFYVSHPELRHELATEAGLARVKDLMNRYPWDIEEEL